MKIQRFGDGKFGVTKDDTGQWCKYSDAQDAFLALPWEPTTAETRWDSKKKYLVATHDTEDGWVYTQIKYNGHQHAWTFGGDVELIPERELYKHYSHRLAIEPPQRGEEE